MLTRLYLQATEINLSPSAQMTSQYHICASQYSDVTRPSWRLKSPATRLFAQQFIQADIEENIKGLHHWPLWGNQSVTGGLPSLRASYTESASMWQRLNGKDTWAWHQHCTGVTWLSWRLMTPINGLSVQQLIHAKQRKPQTSDFNIKRQRTTKHRAEGNKWLAFSK